MRKKKRDQPNAPLPTMFAGDEQPAEEGVPRPPAHVPAPVRRPPPSEPQDLRAQLKAFFSLPPADPPEGPSRAAASTNADDSGDENGNALGCLGSGVGCVAMPVLVVVGGLVEDVLLLSPWQKAFGMAGLVAALLLVSVWVDLNDSDLAYSDRDSEGRMARFRNRLRQLLNIPVV